MGFLDNILGKKTKPIKRDAQGKTTEEAKAVEGSRKCDLCGETINKGTGYLIQGIVPAWMGITSPTYITLSSKIGISREQGDQALAIWYWYCNKHGSEIMAKDVGGIYENGAKYFWKMEKPPNRPPLIEKIGSK